MNIARWMWDSKALFQVKMNWWLLHMGLQVQALLAENAMYKECTGKSVAELELMGSKAIALEVHQKFAKGDVFM